MAPRRLSRPIPTIPPAVARRLAITRQRLAGQPPQPNGRGIMSVIRDLGCLQLDPISVVARSPLLVLWSRLGPYDVADLDALLWQERRLFEYWAPRGLHRPHRGREIDVTGPVPAEWRRALR